MTFVSHVSEYQVILLPVSKLEPQLGQAYRFQRPRSSAPPLEIGLPGGCGPPLCRYFRNARKGPLPALKYLLTRSVLPMLQAELDIKMQSSTSRKEDRDQHFIVRYKKLTPFKRSVFLGVKSQESRKGLGKEGEEGLSGYPSLCFGTFQSTFYQHIVKCLQEPPWYTTAFACLRRTPDPEPTRTPAGCWA